MNSNAMPAIVQIDTDNLKKLTTEVKETVSGRRRNWCKQCTNT